MADLPTCWYCPECGMVFNYQLEAEAGHVGGLPGFLECENQAIVEVPLIPPGTPLPRILDALGHNHHEGFLHTYHTVPNLVPRIEWDVFPVCGYDGDKPVLVVDNPAPVEAT